MVAVTTCCMRPVIRSVSHPSAEPTTTLPATARRPGHRRNERAATTARTRRLRLQHEGQRPVESRVIDNLQHVGDAAKEETVAPCSIKAKLKNGCTAV